MRMLPTLTGMTLAVAASASAQARFELTVPKIMRGVEIGRASCRERV